MADAQQPTAAAPPQAEPNKKKKKVVIVTSGSRGDTQPYVALGLELLARGDVDVTIATEARMEAFVRSFDPRLGFALIPGDPTGMLWQPECQAMLRDGKLMPVLSKVAEHTKAHFSAALDAYAAAFVHSSLSLG